MKKLNRSFQWRPIYSPDVKQKEIDTVLVFSHFYNEITDEIRIRFPNIESIVFGDVGLKTLINY